MSRDQQDKQPGNGGEPSVPLIHEDADGAVRLRRRHSLAVRILCLLCLLPLCAMLLLVGSWGLLQTDTGRNSVREWINGVVVESGIELTELSGALPFSTRLGLRFFDAQGVWLELPECSLVFSLDGFSRVGLRLTADDAALRRLPQPQKAVEGTAVSETLTVQSLKDKLRAFEANVSDFPRFLPIFSVEGIQLRHCHVARAVYDPSFEAGNSGADVHAQSGLDANLEGTAVLAPGEEAGHEPTWKTAQMTCRLTLALAPWKEGHAVDADELLLLFPCLALGGAKLQLEISGKLLAPDIKIGVEADQVASGSLAAKSVKAGCSFAPGFLQALESGSDAGMTVESSMRVADCPFSFSSVLGCALKDSGAELYCSGLQVQAGGLGLTGNLRGRLPASIFPLTGADSRMSSDKRLQTESNPAGSFSFPLFDGKIVLDVRDWRILEQLVPSVRPAGALGGELVLAATADGRQKVDCTLDGKKLVLDTGSGKMRLEGLNFRASLLGNLLAPSGSLRLGLEQFVGAGLKISGGIFSAEGDLEKGVHLAVRCTGDVHASMQGTLARERVEFSRLKVELARYGTGLQLLSPLRIGFSGESLSVHGLHADLLPGGRVDLEGSFNHEACQAKGRIAATRLAAFRRFVPAMPEGRLEANFSLSGSPTRPGGSLVVQVGEVRIPGISLPPLSFLLKASVGTDSEGQRVLAELGMPRESLTALGGESFFLQARVPLKEGAFCPVPDTAGKLAGKAGFHGSIARLWRLAGLADRTLTGRVGLQAELGGSIVKPLLRCDLAIDEGKYKDLPLGLVCDSIRLEAGLSGAPQLELGKRSLHFVLTATDGRKGQLRAEGGMALSGEELSVKASLRDFAPLRRRDLQAVFSADLSLTGSVLAPVVAGEVRLDKGRLQLEAVRGGANIETLPLEEGPLSRVLASVGNGQPGSTQVHNALVQRHGNRRGEVNSTGTPGKGRPSSGAGQGSLAVHFLAPPRFFVTGYGLESQWKADCFVTGPFREPSVQGAVQAVSGRLTLLNRQFTLSRGLVTFAGGLEPLLDIQLASQVSDIEAFVNLTGSVRRIDFVLSSRPELAQEEIISRILFGKGSSELSQYELLQLGATAARMLTLGATSGGVLDFAKKTLGVDVLNVTQDKNGSARLEMGKYLTDKLYVGVEKDGGTKEQTSGIIQLELGPRTSATVKSSGENTSAGIKWKLDY